MLHLYALAAYCPFIGTRGVIINEMKFITINFNTFYDHNLHDIVTLQYKSPHMQGV